MAKTTVTLGSLSIPEGWEVQTQLHLLEPKEDLGGIATLNKVKSPPRSNLVTIQRPIQHDSTEAAVQALLESLGNELEGVEVQNQSTFSFDDGATGNSVTVQFPVNAQLSVLQQHVFRHDGDLETQLTVTVPAQHARKIDDHFASILSSFSLS